MRRSRLTALVVLAGIAAAAIALAAAPFSAAGSSTERAVVKAAFNAKLKTKILVDGHGMTLYVFDQDGLRRPTCYDDETYHCSQTWPPLTTQGPPLAGKGAKRSLLGTVKRTDGTVQVTYARHPLYFFAGYDRPYDENLGCCAKARPDTKPGDVYGQNFIGSWWVLSPKGLKVRKVPK